MDVLFLAHVTHESPGRLARAVRAYGWKVLERMATDADASRLARQASLLVVLGGPQGVYEQDRYPFLTEEITILRERLAERKPIWGVCLGAQLLAAAAGARVYKGKAGFEVGIATIHRVDGSHPFAQALPPTFPTLHWHGDTFDLPTGATLLASSTRYPNQIFAIGTHALGLQCHLEIGVQDVAEFVAGNTADLRHEPGLTPAYLVERTQIEETAMQAAFDKLWHAFVKVNGLDQASRQALADLPPVAGK